MEHNEIFEAAQRPDLEWSNLDLSHEKKWSQQMGMVTPIFCEEVIPGDRWFIQSEIQVRLAPLVFSLEHRVNGYMHYFFTPNRVIWDDWNDFIGGGDEGTVQNPTMPMMKI
jgi:hypothetical protein